MGIKSLFGFGQARDKPVRNYSNGEYSFNFGRSTSGKSVNEMTAMQTTAVYACVRILSEAIASLPIHVYRYKDGGKERVCDHPLYTLISKRIRECVQLEIKRRKKYLEEHGTNAYSHRPESNPFASKIICGDVIRYLHGKAGGAVRELTVRYGNVVSATRSKELWDVPTVT